MAKLSLAAFMAAAVITELSFKKVTFDVKSDGSKTFTLHLDKPIDSVIGSQKLPDEFGTRTIPVEAFDVQSVKIDEADAEDEGFEMNPDGTGTYKGNLTLDVSQKFDVWLTSTKFSQVGAQARRANAAIKQTSMAEAIRQKKIQKGLIPADAAPATTEKLNVVAEEPVMLGKK